MDEAELLAELRDRHAPYLVYEGPYRLWGRLDLPAELASVVRMFEDWRQRIYRFENQFGASVVLYRPTGGRRMRWDLIGTRFLDDGAFAFRYVESVNADLRWREVQGLLDGIKRK